MDHGDQLTMAKQDDAAALAAANARITELEALLGDATDPAKVGGKLGAADREIADLQSLNTQLKGRVKELESQLGAANRRAEANAKPVEMADRKQVLLCALEHDGTRYPAGALMPFDAMSPPPGCGGLLEGTHWKWSV
jgi:hypothetical protein